jgi:hypothetical protein
MWRRSAAPNPTIAFQLGPSGHKRPRQARSSAGGQREQDEKVLVAELVANVLRRENVGETMFIGMRD